MKLYIIFDEIEDVAVLQLQVFGRTGSYYISSLSFKLFLREDIEVSGRIFVQSSYHSIFCCGPTSSRTTKTLAENIRLDADLPTWHVGHPTQPAVEIK